MPPTDRSRPGLVAESLARHGVAAPRGQAVAGAPGARFGRMFDHLPQRDPGAKAVDELAGELRARTAQAFNRSGLPGTVPPVIGDMPAGYTYLASSSTTT